MDFKERHGFGNRNMGKGRVSKKTLVKLMEKKMREVAKVERRKAKAAEHEARHNWLVPLLEELGWPQRIRSDVAAERCPSPWWRQKSIYVKQALLKHNYRPIKNPSSKDGRYYTTKGSYTLYERLEKMVELNLPPSKAPKVSL